MYLKKILQICLLLFCLIVLFACGNKDNNILITNDSNGNESIEETKKDEKNIENEEIKNINVNKEDNYDINNKSNINSENNEIDDKQIYYIQKILNEKINIGDKINFGQHYIRTSNPSTKEGIEWEVVDIIDGKALLASTKIIDCQNMDNENDFVTYKNSSLRNWLNKYFYINAFTEYERELMCDYKITEKDEEYTDKVFIMDSKEHRKYFGEMDVDGANEKAQAFITDWAINRGGFASKKTDKEYFSKSSYWLREVNRQTGLFMHVGMYGHLYDGGQKARLSNGDGVRPCIFIDVDKYIKNNIIKFGYYEQDNNEDNGKEEIEWIVLDKKDNELLLISKNILDYQNFGEYSMSYMKKHATGDLSYDEMYFTHYKDSNLRKFVTESFYNNAFNDNQKDIIKPYKFRAYVSRDYDYKKNEDVEIYDYFEDKCFVMGIDEMQKYYKLYDLMESEIDDYIERNLMGGSCLNDMRAKAKATDYAKSIEIYGTKISIDTYIDQSNTNPSGYGCSKYWLRDASKNRDERQMVGGEYPINDECDYMYPENYALGVRPMIVLDYEKISNIKIEENVIQMYGEKENDIDVDIKQSRQDLLKSKKDYSQFTKYTISNAEYGYGMQLESLINSYCISQNYYILGYTNYIDRENKTANILAAEWWNRKKLYMLKVKFETEYMENPYDWNEGKKEDFPVKAKVTKVVTLTDDEGNEIIDENYTDFVYETSYTKILFYLTNPKALHSFVHLPLTEKIKNKFKDVEIKGIFPDNNYDICITSKYYNDKYKLKSKAEDKDYEYYYRDAIGPEKTKRYKITYKLDNDFEKEESFIDIINVEFVEEFNTPGRVEDAKMERWEFENSSQ